MIHFRPLPDITKKILRGYKDIPEERFSVEFSTSEYLT